MKLTFCGGAKVVTGACYLLETEKSKILVDCGAFQGEKELEAKNNEPFSFNPKEIDAVLITHSHLDHIGRLPNLVEGGFNGRIFATPPTIDFVHLILEDSRKILAEKAKHVGKLSLFSKKDIDQIMGLFIPTEYHQETKISDEISFEFFEAGHILGSAVIKVILRPASPELQRGEQAQDKKSVIVFSGDLGNYPVPILRKPEVIEEADYVLIESTYGDRLHEKADEAKNIIEDVIEEAIRKNGVLMIPSFALERTQQLLFHLNELAENKCIPQIPIFIDSPLAHDITDVYKKHERYFNQEAGNLIKSGDDIFKFPGLQFTHSIKDSKKINNIPPPKVIIAGSGMSQGGRIIHHESLYLSGERNILLLITYQAKGTLGRRIMEGEKEVEILDAKIQVKAKIKNFTGYSAHADQKGLLEWLCNICKPIKKVFVVHGEEEPAGVLAQIIRDEMGLDAQVPEMGSTVELE